MYTDAGVMQFHRHNDHLGGTGATPSGLNSNPPPSAPLYPLQDFKALYKYWHQICWLAYLVEWFRHRNSAVKSKK